MCWNHLISRCQNQKVTKMKNRQNQTHYFSFMESHYDRKRVIFRAWNKTGVFKSLLLPGQYFFTLSTVSIHLLGRLVSLARSFIFPTAATFFTAPQPLINIVFSPLLGATNAATETDDKSASGMSIANTFSLQQFNKRQSVWLLLL